MQSGRSRWQPPLRLIVHCAARRQDDFEIWERVTQSLRSIPENQPHPTKLVEPMCLLVQLYQNQGNDDFRKLRPFVAVFRSLCQIAKPNIQNLRSLIDDALDIAEAQKRIKLA